MTKFAHTRIQKVTLSIVITYVAFSICYFATSYVGNADSDSQISQSYPNSDSVKFGDRVHEKKTPRLLCAVMTIPANHKSKATAVRDTWAKRCDSVLFFTSVDEPTVFPNRSAVVLNISQGRDFLWEKTRSTFLYMNDNYGTDFDWFLKSDDDTYFIIDNLRAFLSGHNPDDRKWFGCEFVHHKTRQRFPSGGAGYVLSRGALTAFAETVSKEKNQHFEKRPEANVYGCGLDGGSMGEDVRFSLCLQSAGVQLIDAEGPEGRFRFLPTMLEHFVYPERNGGNAWITMYKKLGQGIDDCCEKRLISIHYANPKLMYVYEFLIYHLKID